MKHLRLIIMSVTTLFLALSPSLATAYAADFQGDACSGINVLNGSATPDNPNPNCGTSGESGVKKLVGEIVNILSIIIGIAAVIMIIIGGLKYVTSSGDSNAIGSAKNTIIYALVGLVVAVLAQLLVHFVILQVSGDACPYNGTIAASDKNCVKLK